MRISLGLSNRGIEISASPEDKLQPIRPSEDADQEHPRDNYVYAHLDNTDKVFYIGKGKNRHAWSNDRDGLWYRYVYKHLGGKYQVRILKGNLSAEEAVRTLRQHGSRNAEKTS